MANGNSTEKLAQDLMSVVKDMLAGNSAAIGQSQLPAQVDDDTLLESIRNLLAQSARNLQDAGAPSGTDTSVYGNSAKNDYRAMRERHIQEREAMRARHEEERQSLRQEQAQELEAWRYQREAEREEAMQRREMEREARRNEQAARRASSQRPR